MPLLDSLLSIIAPHECLICHKEGGLVCAWCLPDTFPELPSRCFRCMRLTADFAVCTHCRRLTPLRHVWIKTEYVGVAKEILRHYKYERARAAQSVISEAMNEVLPYLPTETIVVPVPTATSRVRQRGYDHAALLAHDIAASNSLLWSHAVAHLTQSRQVGANRLKRMSQLEATFMITKPEIVKNAHVLLVDDVLTTGATLEALASLMKQAGAKSVNALVFAQKQ